MLDTGCRPISGEEMAEFVPEDHETKANHQQSDSFQRDATVMARGEACAVGPGNESVVQIQRSPFDLKF